MGHSATVDRRSSRRGPNRPESKIVIGIMEAMPAQRDAEKPARKIIHLHRLFDRKTDAAQREQRRVDDEAVTDRAARPTGRD
ncbi:hypothetical protein [Kutzneria chonburiensis]|uniref:Uncharacterized protein n=1 Tax=Kutzneria chonburiensis TaxID=1483604 RepID=A0ABV6MZQ6_9PSEU|nr:hypothetical protein [Kutzneria chonburiensis]